MSLIVPHITIDAMIDGCSYPSEAWKLFLGIFFIITETALIATMIIHMVKSVIPC